MYIDTKKLMILQNYNVGNGRHPEPKIRRGGRGVPQKYIYIYIYYIYFLRAISPAETARVFFDGKGVSAPQKHSDFYKKMYSKNQ